MIVAIILIAAFVVIWFAVRARILHEAENLPLEDDDWGDEEDVYSKY